MSDSVDDYTIAVAALGIAIAALIAATLQLAHAILGPLLAVARGLPNCNRAVMGEWSQQSGPKLNLWGLRMEVYFAAPIIYLGPAMLNAGPLRDEAVWHAEGTEESCGVRRSRVSWEEVSEKARIRTKGAKDKEKEHVSTVENERGENSANQADDEKEKSRERVHTVKNEKASWISLLVAIERMERDSKEWEEERQKLSNISNVNYLVYPKPSLTVKMQCIRRMFDSYSDIKRPFATTTLSFIVQLMAVLGLYWKVFNQDQDIYRAEGNGFGLWGYQIEGFGIVFKFEKIGRCVFERKRVIPTSEVKELCFGRVPTLYRRKVKTDEDVEWQDPVYTTSGNGLRVEILQLGSRNEIAETLAEVGCNVATTLYYKEGRQHQHLFPVTFELVGMLARTLYIKNRCFTFLPSPSIFPWQGGLLSFQRLLHAFGEHIKENCATINERIKQRFSEQTSEQVDNRLPEELSPGVKWEVDQIMQLAKDAEDLYDKVGNDIDLKYPQLNDLYDAIEKVDKILDVPDYYFEETGETSSATSDCTPDEGDGRSANQEVVLDVLRRHIQEVLSAINKEKSGQNGKPSNVFDGLLGTHPERRENRFMEIYFVHIFWGVFHVSASFDEEHKEHEDHKRAPRTIHEEAGNRWQSTYQRTRAHATPADAGFHRSDGFPGPLLAKTRSWSIKKPPARIRDWDVILQEPLAVRRVKIWYTLVFRMICWLMLHNFDKRDVQVPSIAVMGSRQPAFII